MSEYIIEWSGIGADMTDMLNNHVPPCLWPKRIREDRRRERIVRCRDCTHYELGELGQGYCIWEYYTDWECEPDGFCAWGERRQA